MSSFYPNLSLFLAIAAFLLLGISSQTFADRGSSAENYAGTPSPNAITIDVSVDPNTHIWYLQYDHETGKLRLVIRPKASLAPIDKSAIRKALRHIYAGISVKERSAR